MKEADDDVLSWVDPGTGLTVEDLIDAIIRNPREAKSLKAYLRDKQEERRRGTKVVKWVD